MLPLFNEFDKNLVFVSVRILVFPVILSVYDLILNISLYCLSKHSLERSKMDWTMVSRIDLVNNVEG